MDKLREMAYKGVNTIAMIYDDYPTIDYFRYVAPDVVLGIMDMKQGRAFGLWYFFLTRLPSDKKSRL